jgi:hypothetical protein
LCRLARDRIHFDMPRRHRVMPKQTFPVPTATSEMDPWQPEQQIGQKVRADRVPSKIPLNPFTAGVFCGVMIAQVDTLLEFGHSYSEIAN